MRSSTYLYAYLFMNSCIHGLPTARDHALTARSETADGDDQVVYSWSLPEEKFKVDGGNYKRSETADGDDQVVYSWSLPEEKMTPEDGLYERSETADEDDQVFYSWSLPEEKATS